MLVLLEEVVRFIDDDGGVLIGVSIESAGEITETLRALASDPMFEGESEDFRARMLQAIEQAAALERAIEISDRDEARARFQVLGASCVSCHRVYRD